ncbi:MAG TPA: PaaI family thioesterase [Pyrinomonadaceae bacterium]
MEVSEERRRSAIERLNALPFSKLIGMRMTDIRPKEAVIELDVRDDLLQPGGILHGGVTATLIDTAMAFAVRTYLSDTEPTATIDLTVHYLRPISSGRAVCTARVVRPGKRIFTVSAEVHNGEGKLLATGLSTYTRLE